MRIFLGLVAVLLSANMAYAADAVPVWHWIWVTPSPDPARGWITFEGDAPVTFKGSHFDVVAEGQSDKWQPRLEVKGRVKGKTAEAVVTLLDSDSDPERYRGGRWTLRRKAPDPFAAWSSDRIWLYAGGSYFGLYRQRPVPTKGP